MQNYWLLCIACVGVYILFSEYEKLVLKEDTMEKNETTEGAIKVLRLCMNEGTPPSDEEEKFIEFQKKTYQFHRNLELFITCFLAGIGQLGISLYLNDSMPW